MNRKLFNLLRAFVLMATLGAAVWGEVRLSILHQDAYPYFYDTQVSTPFVSALLLLLLIYVLMPLFKVWAGFVSGYSLYQLQLPFLSICSKGKVQPRLSRQFRPGIFMLPPRTDGTSPYRLYLLSLPLTFLVMALLTALLTALCWHTAATRTLLPLTLVCTSVLCVLLLPRKNGDLLWPLLLFPRAQEAQRAWECSLHISAALSEDKRLHDMPGEWFTAVPPVHAEDIYVQVYTINSASRLMREHRFQDAYALMRPLFDLTPAPQTHQTIACSILNGAVCEALEGLPPMCLSQLEHTSVKYMLPPNWQPRLALAKYARALLLNHNEEEAATYLPALEQANADGQGDETLLRMLQEKAGIVPAGEAP